MTFYLGLAIGWIAGCLMMVMTASLWSAKAADNHAAAMRTQCSVCGRIIEAGRDRRNLRNWRPADYDHSCSHGLCPDCYREAMKDR